MLHLLPNIPSLDFRYIGFLSVPMAWIPVIALVGFAWFAWSKADPRLRKACSPGKRRALITPTVVIGEMMVLAAWQQRHWYDTRASDHILLLFFALFPLALLLIWRLRHCWLFATLICLAQIWFALAVLAAIACQSAPALRIN